MFQKNTEGRVARILLLAEGFWSFGSGLFLPIFAIFSEKVGGDITDAGIAAAIFLFATSTLEIFVGRFLDKFKEKWFLVVDYFMESLIFLGYFFVDNKWELFALQLFLGIANAIGDPSWESLYGRHAPKRHSGKHWAFSHLYIGYASALGILLGCILVSYFGFGIVFILGSIFSFIAAIVTMFKIKN